MSLLTAALIQRRLDELESRLPGAPIYGAYWDKGPDPTLIRTHDAVGMEAAVGVDGQWVHNDFDRAEIFGEMGPVTDEYGNTFIRIPKFYIRKTDGPGYKTWAVSKHKYPGFYLPWCFWDFERGRELPYIDLGKYKASNGPGNVLESKPDVHPLVMENIVTFRNRARANNTDGRRGYQLMDVHAYDVIRTLMFIEFATLDMQSVMRGFTEGQYSSAHTATVEESETNRIIVTNGVASGFVVGQSIGIGTSISNNDISGDHRVITAIEPYDENNSAIEFDGDPIDIQVGSIVANRGYRTGWSRSIAASSGSPVSGDNGKYPCMYRGIESPYGDVWDWVDGLNINNHQAWVARNAEDYASNVFAEPYQQLAFANKTSNGYLVEEGFDPVHPYVAGLALEGSPNGSASTYYCDNYSQSSGQRVARVGGSWGAGSEAGPSRWSLTDASSTPNVFSGGRLVKKPL